MRNVSQKSSRSLFFGKSFFTPFHDVKNANTRKILGGARKNASAFFRSIFHSMRRSFFPKKWEKAFPSTSCCCVREWARTGDVGWKKRRTLGRENFFYFGSRIFFARKKVACFRWPGGWLGGFCRRKIYDMYARRIHKTTHISLSLKEEIHDCIGCCFCGWVKKECIDAFIRARIRSILDSVTLV